jgi:hypothetical protein
MLLTIHLILPVMHICVVYDEAYSPIHTGLEQVQVIELGDDVIAVETTTLKSIHGLVMLLY